MKCYIYKWKASLKEAAGVDGMCAKCKTVILQREFDSIVSSMVKKKREMRRFNLFEIKVQRERIAFTVMDK